MTTKHKHTPAPWKFIQLGARGQNQYQRNYILANGCSIAWLEDTSDVESDHKNIVEANANLITAAPDMYKAINKTIDNLDTYVKLNGCTSLLMYMCIEYLKGVIKKIDEK